MFNQIEYNTVMLGGLLHDIGKLLNRVEDIIKKHPYLSAQFIEREELKNIINPEWVDFDVLKTLCQYHHERGDYPEDLQVKNVPDTHKRALAYIVSRADTYSSKERSKSIEFKNEDEKKVYFKKSRLSSIFSHIDIGREESQIPTKYYDLNPLSYLNAFPKDKNNLNLDTYSYKTLVERDFPKALKNLDCTNFNNLYNGLFSILEKYLWCVPSDTTKPKPDISLFDHLSTTSAIAASLYLYHCDNFDEKEITNNTKEKFLLISGDLSGIQKFIFEIKSTNPKKINKILRGRSFYLSLLTDAISVKILNALNLPVSCRVMNAGGQFVILAPNTTTVKEKLITIDKEISKWFLDTFLGKLSLNLVYDVALSGENFGNIVQILKALRYELELKKQTKFKNIIMNLNFMKKLMNFCKITEHVKYVEYIPNFQIKINVKYVMILKI